MSNGDKILVFGASGHVGGAVVKQALASGLAVRAVTRGDAPERTGPAEWVSADLTDPKSIDSVAKGVSSVFLIWPFGSAAGVEDLISALSRHVQRIVYLSAAGLPLVGEPADPTSQTHADVEHAIRASQAAWTFVRSGGMATNTLHWAAQVRSGIVRFPHGNASRSLVHEDDLAAVVLQALGGKHDHEIHAVTGPQSLTQIEQVKVIGKAIGREVSWEDQPRDEFIAMMAGGGFQVSTAEGMVDAWGRMVERPEVVFDTVRRLTGQRARSYQEWVADHIDDFLL